MPKSPILIVGTTSDYIDLISRQFSEEVLFLTDRMERSKAIEPQPPNGTEILTNLKNYEETFSALNAHFDKRGGKPAGITCFDCESMRLAARLAQEMSLRYPSPESIRICRNKYESKRLWRKAGLPCPRAELVYDADGALALQRQMEKTVIKPIAGSGSEYVFACNTQAECSAAVANIRFGLSEHKNDPMKPLYSRDSTLMNDGSFCVMEEFVQGEEYSCDFIIDGDRLQIVRIARKVPLRNTCFGTTLAYQLCPQLPEPLNLTDFHSQLWEAANVMGLDRAICMLDFIVTDKDAVMIEMTPRPGGDCIPPLLKQSAGFDMLSFAVRFAEGKQGEVPELSEWKPYVGLRLLTAKEGVVERFNTDALRYDQRVLNYHLKHNSGHTVVLPPNDYDSRVLGYVIFDPSRSGRIEPECLEIADLLRIEWKEF